MRQLYDEIGIGYAQYRRLDPRFVAAITQALGDLDPVVNIGAAAGSYEPPIARRFGFGLKAHEKPLSQVSLIAAAGVAIRSKVWPYDDTPQHFPAKSV